jgi:hypothetical protein
MVGAQDPETRESIERVGMALTDLLLEKNKRYGNSALKPPKIFGSGDPLVNLSARIDDKLARIIQGYEVRKNDVADLVGYLMLYCVLMKWDNFDDLLD